MNTCSDLFRSDKPLRILCLGAHADDIEIGCGGTVLRILQEHPGSRVLWAVFSGNRVRQQEARSSARDFLQGAGRSQVRCASFRESFFPDQWSLIKREFEALRGRMEPDLVLTHTRGDRHQDHRVLSDLAWNTFRSQPILEYEIPKYDADLGQPNLFVRLEPATAEGKVKRIETHFQSQRPKHWFERETFLGLMRIRGVECAARYAEAFHCRKWVM
jgi:LmbE family N-acetylglucosaminyl deacetylase